MGPGYSPLDSAGVCSMRPYFEHDIQLLCIGVQTRGGPEQGPVGRPLEDESHHPEATQVAQALPWALRPTTLRPTQPSREQLSPVV